MRGFSLFGPRGAAPAAALAALASLLFLFLVPAPAGAIELGVIVPRLGTKCFGEMVLAKTLFVASAEPVAGGLGSVSGAGPAPEIQLRVQAGQQATIFEEAGRGPLKTAFTTAASGEHRVCVSNLGAAPAEVKLTVVHGPAARDYSQVARREHLDPIVRELREFEDLIRDYHRSLMHLRSREPRGRAGLDRLIVCSVAGSVLAVLGSTALQFLYFRQFFKNRKLI